jgi:acetyl esterase/lipase
MLRRLLVCLILLGSTAPAFAQARVERNVVYGMVSGLGLLMDVYRPAQPNGIGIVVIQGSGWYQPLRYDALPLKTLAAGLGQRFAAAGYTVFTLNHRAAPRFRYPDQVDDAQRAVRFIRAHAADYGIAPDRIGAWGASSGGYLAEMLGTLDGTGRPDDADAVNRESAKVQAVVALAAPADLAAMFPGSVAQGTVSAFMGFTYPPSGPTPPRPEDVEVRAYRQASPMTHASAGDAPTLLMHGDQDVIVPIGQSEAMDAALRKAGVEVRFVRVPGGRHGPNFELPAGDPNRPDDMSAAVQWFDAHLKTAPAPVRVSTAAAAPPPAPGQVERNVLYGMVSGLGLLLDVYRPAQPNGIAIVAIQGSGWYQPLRYDAPPLKEREEVVVHAERFQAAGYTVFAINHRSAPRFHYPDPVDDAQRAVRFIRAHAADYGVTSDRVGAWGSSSGGHLVEMLGTLDGAGDASDADPVNRLSAKVQAVVALFAPADMPTMHETSARQGTVSALMGFAYQPATARTLSRVDDPENVAYREASPVTHVDAGDAPMLLFHGDQDVIVPFAQSEMMAAALQKAGVEVRLVKVPTGKHGPNFQMAPGDPNRPDHKGAAIAWFDAHLKTAP